MSRGSKILRRSGLAATDYLRFIDFTPKQVILAGVGCRHEEITVMRECWPQMELYGFEPNPLTYGGIKDSFPGILKNQALWSKTLPEMIMHAKPNWKDGSSVHHVGSVPGWHEFKIPAVALDDMAWLPSDGRSVFLWLDCEGSEAEALRGGRSFIQERVAVINIEMTCRPRLEGWPKALDVHHVLTGLGFYHVWVHTIRSSIGQYDAVYLHKSMMRSDITCCPDAAMMAAANNFSVLSCP